MSSMRDVDRVFVFCVQLWPISHRNLFRFVASVSVVFSFILLPSMDHARTHTIDIRSVFIYSFLSVLASISALIFGAAETYISQTNEKFEASILSHPKAKHSLWILWANTDAVRQFPQPHMDICRIIIRLLWLIANARRTTHRLRHVGVPSWYGFTTDYSNHSVSLFLFRSKCPWVEWWMVNGE